MKASLLRKLDQIDAYADSLKKQVAGLRTELAASGVDANSGHRVKSSKINDKLEHVLKKRNRRRTATK